MEDIKGELHITLMWEANKLEDFKTVCKDLGFKPIVIELENKLGYRYLQVMTSSICNVKSIQEEVSKWYKYAEVERVKFEIKPETDQHPNHLYYETHFRLQLDKTYVRSLLIEAAKTELPDCYFSKNLFKKTDTYMYQMVTCRAYDITYKEFLAKVKEIAIFLRYGNIFFDKVEIEECIYDSNISLDNLWFKK